MKKILFAAIMALVAFCGSAQTKAKYQGEVQLGYSVGVGDFSAGRVNLHTVQGAKIGDHFSAGLGIGFDFYHDLGDGCDLLIPIYLNMKGYIPVNDDLSPYVSLDLGYGAGASGNLKSLGGFYWGPSVGIRYKHFEFQLGYTSQRISDSGIGFDMSAIQFKVGVAF